MIEKVIFLLLSLLLVIPNVNPLISEKWGTTTLEVNTLKYTWTIKNFNASQLLSVNYLVSPEFWPANQPDYKWRLQLHKEGDYLSVFLQFRSHTRVKVLYTISMDTYTKTTTSSYGFDGNAGFSRIMHVNSLYKAKNQYDDTVVVNCEIQRLVGEKNRTSQCQEAASKKSFESELIDDMETLLDQEIFSDVTLTIDNNEIPAHKAILAARSSFFRKMLAAKFSDSNNRSIIVINDVEPRVFKEVLRYIYTGKVEHIEKIAKKLLIAANSYDIKGLKTMCEEYLCKSLKDDNAMEILELADKHEAHMLSSEAAGFVASRGSSIIHTPEFKSMERKNHNPFFDIFRAYFEN